MAESGDIVQSSKDTGNKNVCLNSNEQILSFEPTNETFYIYLIGDQHQHILDMRGSRGGRGRGPDPLKKSQKYRVSLQYLSGSPGKSQNYKASIQLSTRQRNTI